MTQLGIVTYNIAKDWDLPTILTRLEKLGYAGVELRTTHAHKVEVNLTKAQRDEVRKRFEDSPVRARRPGQRLRVPGDRPGGRPQEHRGDQGVRPPGPRHRLAGREGPAQRHPQGGRPRRRRSARSAGPSTRSARTPRASASRSASRSTAASPRSCSNFARIIEYADHPNVYACWNSNPTDVDERLDQARPSPWSPPRSARSTSATSPTRPTPGASCSPCWTPRATRATPWPRSPRAPTPSGCCATSGPCGWPINPAQRVAEPGKPTVRVLIGRWLAGVLCLSDPASVALSDRSEAGLAIRRRGRTQGFGVATWRR